MTDDFNVFLSYSRTDLDAATLLGNQLRASGLSVFHDQAAIRNGDLWLERLQETIDACGSLVLLVGREGVRRWIGAEVQAALNRHFGPHEDDNRLPIFPILLSEAEPDSLPAFLRLFQATSWDGTTSLPGDLIKQIRERNLVSNQNFAFDGCPFVGLDAYQPNQANLFFGRQKETLDALACFDQRIGHAPIRWLEINGNSGSGKSSLMNAGLLPLIDQGWLWPRTDFASWQRIGPMMPGARPLSMLAEHLARVFDKEMSDVRDRIGHDHRSLAEWLRSRKPDDETAFLLALDQFEELFTFADKEERLAFDKALAGALEDGNCPLFVISTVRSDFLDRFDELPRLVAARNRLGRPWTLPMMSSTGLREVIDGPARLADLDVSEVREAMIREALDEPGALPLVQNALNRLWEQRENGRLLGKLLTEWGGLAGILAEGADDLIGSLDSDRERALELLFCLTKIAPEGQRHTRRRIPIEEAIAVTGGGETGQRILSHLSGARTKDGAKPLGSLRLITVSEEAVGDKPSANRRGWVNLIHETLIRSKSLDEKGRPQPYWPTLWRYIEHHKRRAARRERFQLMAREWQSKRGPRRLTGLAGWPVLFGSRHFATPGTVEHRYLRWSAWVLSIQIAFITTLLGITGEALWWKTRHELPLEAIWTRWTYWLGKDLPMPAFAPIPAGTFQMGSSSGGKSERPVRTVNIDMPFDLAKTEVTFEQYDAFATATGRPRPDDSRGGRGNLPVINVDFEDARAYVVWLGVMTGRTCRLPSEAEWEYACRAGTTTPFHFGDELTVKQANVKRGHANTNIINTREVASYPANAWQLHDMHGNVYEWVEDCWHENYEGAPRNSKARSEVDQGDCSDRVFRGGAWNFDQSFARCAARQSNHPNFQGWKLGFRVVCMPSILVR